MRVTVRGADGAPKVLAGTHLLLAAGRTPTSRAWVSMPRACASSSGRIVVDDRLRTTNRRIYVIGDAAGGQQFTHLAEHHAGIVLRHAIFRMRWAKPSRVVPWCTFTDPELARVGLSESEAKQQGVAHRVYRFPFADIDRARADERDRTALPKSSPTRRASSSARRSSDAHAGELIAEYVLALSKGMNAQRADRRHPHLPNPRADQPPRCRPADEGRADADRRSAGSSGSSACEAREDERATGDDTGCHGGPLGPDRAPGRVRGRHRRVLRAGRSAATSASTPSRRTAMRCLPSPRRITPRRSRSRSSPTSRAVGVQPPGRAGAVADDGLPVRPLGRQRCSWSSPRRSARRSCFLAARYLFADAARRRMGALGAKINAGFSENAFNYLLFLRLVPVFPFFLVNLAPAFTTIRVRTFALGTLIGIIPGTFVYRESRADARSHRFAVRHSLGRDAGRLCLLGLLALVPVLVRKFRRVTRGRRLEPHRRHRRPLQSDLSRFVEPSGTLCTPRCRCSKRPNFPPIARRALETLQVNVG